MSEPLTFTPFRLPDGRTAWVPADIELRVPEHSALGPDRLHSLVYIPWHDRYLDRVPPALREFFGVVLPYLRARTTDVHVAVWARQPPL